MLLPAAVSEFCQLFDVQVLFTDMIMEFVVFEDSLGHLESLNLPRWAGKLSPSVLITDTEQRQQ